MNLVTAPASTPGSVLSMQAYLSADARSAQISSVALISYARTA